MRKKRIEEIDIIKALGIICMVAGHSGAPFTKFIYLFHMAIFFIASGFFYKEQSTDTIRSLCESILKKVKQLWIPFFVWNVIFTLLNNFFININVYTDNVGLLDYVQGKYIGIQDYLSSVDMIKNIIKGAFFSGGTQMGGAFWFLKILFMVSVSYSVGDYFIKKIFKKNTHLVQLILALVLLVFGYCCSLKDFNRFGMAQTASYYCLYFMGYMLSFYKEKYTKWDWKKYLLVFIVTFVWLLVLNTMGRISLDDNSYMNPVFLLAASFSGWWFLYSMSYFVTFMPHVKNILIVIGKRTLSVVVLHFLAMKLVALIVICSYDMPSYCVAAFPNLYGNRGLWWLAYTVIGVFVPVGLNILGCKLVGCFKEGYNNLCSK